MLDWAESAIQSFQASPYFWDVITFVCLTIVLIGVMVILLWLLGLPGRIAIARNHPDAEAVYAMGWAGFAAIVPWIQALIWAFKPTEKIDIRYFPEAEAAAERADLERLSKYVYGRKRRQDRKKPAEETGTERSGPDPESGAISPEKGGKKSAEEMSTEQPKKDSDAISPDEKA